MEFILFGLTNFINMFWNKKMEFTYLHLAQVGCTKTYGVSVSPLPAFLFSFILMFCLATETSLKMFCGDQLQADRWKDINERRTKGLKSKILKLHLILHLCHRLCCQFALLYVKLEASGCHWHEEVSVKFHRG